MGEDTKEIKVHKQPLHKIGKVQEKAGEDESSDNNNMESETESENVDVDNEQIATDQESDDVEDKHREADAMQRNNQL